MKKIASILVALLPLIYVGTMVTISKNRVTDEQLFVILGVYTLMGFLFPIFFSTASKKAERRFLAVSNVWFYAGNLVLLVAQIIYWLIRFEENRIAEQNGAIEGGLGLFLLIVLFLPHWISYLFTRVAGAVSCSRALKGVCRQEVRILHTILQLFIVTDLLSAIWVCCKVSRTTSETTEP